MRSYSSFSEAPIRNGFNMFVVIYDGVDENAPDKTNASWWWNCLQFGATTRLTQLAWSPYRNKNVIFIRQNHDGVWSGWFDINNTAYALKSDLAQTEDITSALTSDYGNIVSAKKLRIGNLVSYSILVNITTEVPANRKFVSGVLKPLLDYSVGVAIVGYDNVVDISVYFAQQGVYSMSKVIPIGRYAFTDTYIIA